MTIAHDLRLRHFLQRQPPPTSLDTARRRRRRRGFSVTQNQNTRTRNGWTECATGRYTRVRSERRRKRRARRGRARIGDETRRESDIAVAISRPATVVLSRIAHPPPRASHLAYHISLLHLYHRIRVQDRQFTFCLREDLFPCFGAIWYSRCVCVCVCAR